MISLVINGSAWELAPAQTPAIAADPADGAVQSYELQGVIGKVFPGAFEVKTLTPDIQPELDAHR